jgi:hypothetical protein
MRLLGVVLVFVLVGCGSDGKPDVAAVTSTPEATTTTVDVSAYCRLMERTELAYSDGDLMEQVQAEADRIAEAPAELEDEYAYFGDDEPGVPNEVIARIQDWTQRECGFLPTFG